MHFICYNENMKKFANVRVPSLCAAALIAGVTAGCICAYFTRDIKIIAAIAPVCAALFILLYIAGKARVAKIIAVTCLFLIVGALAGSIKTDVYSRQNIPSEIPCRIEGVIREYGDYDGGNYVIISSAKADGKRVGGKICAYFAGGTTCKAGYAIRFTAPLEKCSAFTYGKISDRAIENIKYVCHTNGEAEIRHRFAPLAALRTDIKNLLYDNLSPSTATVAYAMLTGETSQMEQTTLTTFRNGGVAHIFAVSGLHIGLVYGILNFICKKLKLNRYVKTAVCLTVATLYAGLCGFTLSSVRALIMCFTAGVAALTRNKRDSLNSLAAAVIIILLISPLSLFSAGFALSVCAVTGIAALSARIRKALHKLPRRLADSVAVSLSAQAGTMPVSLTVFGYISGAGLLLNIIIIPLLSACFAMLFTGTAAGLIFPYVSKWIIKAACAPLEGLLSFLVSCGFEKSLLKGFGGVIFVAAYIICAAVVSDKANISVKKRIVIAAIGVAVMISSALGGTYMPLNNYRAVCGGDGYGTVTVLRRRGKSIVITDGKCSAARVKNFLDKQCAGKISALIMVGGADVTAVTEYGENFGCVYLYGAEDATGDYEGTTVNYRANFVLDDIYFAYGDEYNLNAQVERVNITFSADGAEPDYGTELYISAKAYYGQCKYSLNCDAFIHTGYAAFDIRGAKIEKACALKIL